MKLFLSILITFCCSVSVFAQQITVDSSQSPQELIENNLVQGCVSVENISSPINGSVNNISSFGYFDKSGSNFPFENGIVLSSGNVMSLGGGVNTNALNEGDTSWETDVDLETALGITNTLNATSFSFDFTSATGTIQFNYILASEEYFQDYPCNYSDGFAFLIKEAGTNQPYQNIAVLPESATPVNTSTIHEEIVGFCDAENETFFEGYNIGDTNFNGRSAVLSASASITPNVQYNIKLIIADQTDRNFDSAVFIEGNSFTDNVNLGADFSTCEPSTILNADTNNALATYQWFFNNNIINGETANTLNVNESGNYNVVVTIPINDTTCSFDDDINIIVNSIQEGPNFPNYRLCDDISGDGIETFDLSTLTSTVDSSLPSSNNTITYHSSNQDAIANNNNITSINNTTNPQSVFIRSQDINSGCIYISTVNLVVNPLPAINQSIEIESCSSDVSTGIFLTAFNIGITNGNVNYSVTYHNTQTEAGSGINAISSPYIPASNTEQLFVRIVDITTGCEALTDITIILQDSADVNTDTQEIILCEQDNDGFEFFDLTSVIVDVLQGETDVNTTYHTTYIDANTGENTINDPTNFENTTPFYQVVFIRIENQNNSCYEIIPIELHTNRLRTATNITNFDICDEAPDDGIAEFNLTDITVVIANGLPDVTITYFETQQDLNDNANAINDSVPYSVNNSLQILYILIEDLECSFPSEIELSVNPTINIEAVDPIDYCSATSQVLTTVNLASINTIVTDGIDSPIISYHDNEIDAIAGTNILVPFYNNTTNPFNVYVRVANTSGCFDVETLNITVFPSPETTTPNGFVICDTDDDGFSIVDLTTKDAEISGDLSAVSISYYLNASDANMSTNSISNPSAYNTQTGMVIARVDSNNSSCYSIENINIIVNTLPSFTNISNFVNCETDGNQIADFILSQKDTEILNGQTGKTVSYYETEANAIAGTNAIDKNNIYNNTSQVQTLYVRVENITDQSCFSTSSFEIEVGSVPIFNTPQDINTCDDMSNDGFETFDLNEQRQAIIANSTDTNLTVSFYLTENEALNAINALPDAFTNTVNPQQIFASINNNTICNGITSFEYSVIQVAQINNAPNLEQCDTNLDGIVSFDLTTVEVDVLAIRQDDFAISYYENEADMLSNSNPILNPENYTNTTNPQTVYIEVTNTVSNCGVSVGFELIVNLPPVITAIDTIHTCQNDADVFDLSTVINDLIGTQNNVTTTFHSSANDAQLNQNSLNTNYSYATNNDTIYVRAQFSNTGCYSTASFNLQVNPIPRIPIVNLLSCDDDFDGFLYFDLSQHTNLILANQNTSTFSVSYFETENDAIDNTNAILDLNYEAENGQNIYLRITNTNTGCFITESITVTVLRKPEVEITDQVVCIDNLPLTVDAETNVDTDTYLWSTGETTSTIEINSIGDFAVMVTTVSGCTTTSNFNVSTSQQATVDFEVSPAFQDPHTIEVEASGIGNYVYQLDDNEPQESNVFNNVPIGVHYITVIDLNGCEPTPPKKVFVIDVPKFVTPNGDGYFDFWHITGVSQLPGTVVTIFDRYGKQLKVLKHNDYGWDGIYNGKKMPANDYWYVADVVNLGEEFQLKGHFSLRL